MDNRDMFKQLEESILAKDAFHAKPSYGPSNGAEVVVPVSVAMKLERRLSIIAADAAAISDEWLDAQPEGIRIIIASIRIHAQA